jgi:hypothetical protein
MSNANEIIQVLLDQVASGQLSGRRFMTVAGAAGLTAGLPAAMVDQAFAAGDNQAANQAKLEGAYHYIVVGAGASGAIVAGELSKTGAKVLVVESGRADTLHDRRPRRRTDQGRQMMKEADHVLHCRRSPPHSSRCLLARNGVHMGDGSAA